MVHHHTIHTTSKAPFSLSSLEPSEEFSPILPKNLNSSSSMNSCGLSEDQASLLLPHLEHTDSLNPVSPKSSSRHLKILSMLWTAKLSCRLFLFQRNLKQSALFAHAVSDIELINMWCHDIGPEKAANKPLLKTVVQTWDNVPKPQAHEDTPLSKFFNIRHYVTALNSCKEKEEQFKEQDAFEKALKGGEAFAVAAHDCTQSFILEFGKRCADVAIKQANWDATKVRDKIHRDIEAHVDSTKMSKINWTGCWLLKFSSYVFAGKLNKALSEPVESLPDAASNETWPSIRNLLQRETKIAVSGFTGALSSFDINDSTLDEMVANLERYARSVVETKAREEAGRVLIRMKDRFATLFSRDSDSMPRVWTGKEDIRGITKAARIASLKLLSVMAVLRLEEDSDSIENTLALAIVDTNNKKVASVDPLASSTWEETEYSVSQAIAAQEANKRNNWIPPPWAILALVVLGVNEFMTLLRNPLWFLVIFVGLLLVKALWIQLDILGEFRNGAIKRFALILFSVCFHVQLPGLLSLSTKHISKESILSLIHSCSIN
ncbi:hypothetical protein MKX03_013291 [Papaver bracteatum]|nr:hypothetical protein MKX03_013291 [Papaver bracteatum]